MARKPASEKASTAYRTIGEAAEMLGVAQHVLRFWETKFPELQPLKRGGGRRYYRPADMALLEAIRTMLHDQGLTIRGAQQLIATSKSGQAAEVTPLEAPDLPPALTRAAPQNAQSTPETAPKSPETAPATPASLSPELRNKLLAVRNALATALAA